jgi:hypothetical protein
MHVITLSNGKRVGNFSSPHSFTFTDGSVLPAVSVEEAERLKVDFHEEDLLGNGDVSLSFSLSDVVRERVIDLNDMWCKEEIDVVFVPLPMLTTLKNIGWDVRNSPFRAVRIEDRILKLISIDKQCL